MTDLYNMTVLEDSTNIYDLFAAINTLSTNIFGIVIFLFLTLIVMIIFRGREPDFSNVILGTSFISSIIGVLLWAVKMLDITFLVIPIIFLAGSVFFKLWKG